MTTIGVIGFGDLGAAFVAGIHGRWGYATPVYCAGARHRPPYDAAFRARVAAAGGTLVESPAELANAADMLISAVVPTAALAVAEAFAPHLGPGHVFVDVNSCAPETKRAIADLLAPRGARVVDAALLASPRNVGLRMPFVVSGDGAAAFRDATAPLGLEIEVLAAPAGAAALIKMLRSVLAKGIAALAIELLIGARRAGVASDILRYTFEWLERDGLTRQVLWYVRSTCLHAGRRVGEMEEVIATLRAYGVPPRIATATRDWQAAIAAQGLKERFGGEPPPDWQTALAALDEGLER